MRKAFVVLLFALLLPFSANAATCSAGYYLNNGQCADCLDNHYCPGNDTMYECPAITYTDQQIKQLIEDRGYTVQSFGSAQLMTLWARIGRENISIDHCLIIVTGIRVTQGDIYVMSFGYSSSTGNYTRFANMFYDRANPGYYLSNAYTSGLWWGVKACTNPHPANSHYSGAGTPDSLDGTIVDANDCPWACDDGYYDNNGTCTLCPAGTYWNNGTCDACGSGYFCTGGTNRTYCGDIIDTKGTSPDFVSFVSLSSGSWDDYTHGASISDCVCNFYFHDESTRREYYYQSGCNGGPVGNPYRQYDWCNTGYYAAGPLGWGNWYTSCQPCTNKPANSHYTSYSTPSTMYAVESNCPWACDSGYGLTSNNTCEQLCTAGVTGLHTSTGLVFNLYANKQTSPAIHIMPDGTNTVCYTSLAPGAANNAVNVEFNGAIYHSID